MSEGPASNDREQELREEYMRLWEARDASEGHRVLSRRLSLSNGLDVFRGNHAELRRFLNHVAAPSVMAHMWNQAHPYRLDYAQREAARLLHNYVAAAFSLVDSTRVFVERHYAGTALLGEYKARVQTEFAESPLHRFLQQLRNYALHYRQPPMRAVNSFKRRNDGGDNIDNGFWLNVERLREWDDWTGKAREYLDSLGETVKLDAIIDAYEPVVVGFHGWLQARILEEHAGDIEETFDLKRRMKEAHRRAYGDDPDPPQPAPEQPERHLVLASLVGPSARKDWDALAAPDDVVVSLYASLSFPHGGLPNLDRFRSLFLPNAQLVEVEQDGTYLTDVDDYVGRLHRELIGGSVTAVSEHETARRSHPLGDVAHVLSFHETRYVEDGERKRSLGMYDIHMVKAGDRWAITGMHLCAGYGARLERSPRARTPPEDESGRGGVTQ
ncbi:MAG: hypothetical protein M3R38_00490 [Actinomycetota bacterium]|nr:hypothetical protein [Actinomycetota bacterium]